MLRAGNVLLLCFVCVCPHWWHLQLVISLEDFHLPTVTDDRKYFPDYSLVQAKEHRNVMQVLPHIMYGLDEQLTVLAIK